MAMRVLSPEVNVQATRVDIFHSMGISVRPSSFLYKTTVISHARDSSFTIWIMMALMPFLCLRFVGICHIFYPFGFFVSTQNANRFSLLSDTKSISFTHICDKSTCFCLDSSRIPLNSTCLPSQSSPFTFHSFTLSCQIELEESQSSTSWLVIPTVN